MMIVPEPRPDARGRGRAARGRAPGALVGITLSIGFLASRALPQDFPQNPAPPPPPDFLSRKPMLPKEIVDEKSEGRYVTGIPNFGLDPEDGPIVGASVQIFDNGSRSDPFFAYSPYRQQLQVGAIVGVQRNVGAAWIAYDRPYVADTPWRVRAYLGYLENKFTNYFGTGEETLEPLHYPGSPQTFRKIDEFNEAIQSTAGGITWARFVDFDQTLYVGAVNLEYDLLGGLLRPLVGLQISHVGVRDYTGEEVDGAVEQETQLAQDHRLGKILGFNGGWDNNLRLGLAYDSRDYEPDPTTGLLAQAFLLGSLKPIGSAFNYGQSTFGLTGYATPVPDYPRLVVVGNVLYSLRFGDVPFYAMNRLALPKDEVRTGLGSWPTLRGYASNRFVGMTTVGANAELRWSFAETTFLSQHLKFAVAPFVDGGRVFDGTGGFSFQDWKYSYGVGLKLAWNLATVISFDYGIGPEGSLFFMELGHAF